MRFAIAPIAAAALLCACSGPEPTPQEEALPETGSEPELTANSAAGVGGDMGNPSVATGTDRTRGGDTPGGPISDTGSGTGGDTAK